VDPHITCRHGRQIHRLTELQHDLVDEVGNDAGGRLGNDIDSAKTARTKDCSGRAKVCAIATDHGHETGERVRWRVDRNATTATAATAKEIPIATNGGERAIPGKLPRTEPDASAAATTGIILPARSTARGDQAVQIDCARHRETNCSAT